MILYRMALRKNIRKKFQKNMFYPKERKEKILIANEKSSVARRKMKIFGKSSFEINIF